MDAESLVPRREPFVQRLQSGAGLLGLVTGNHGLTWCFAESSD